MKELISKLRLKKKEIIVEVRKDEWTRMIIHSFSAYMKVYYVPDTPLNTGNKAMNKIESVPTLMELRLPGTVSRT